MDVKMYKRGELDIRLRMKIPYDTVAEGIKSGHDVFVSDIGRQTAYYASKKLSKMVGDEVVALPTIVDGEKGYFFTTKTAIKEWAKEHGINISD